jgi:hypothetical protein
MAHFRPVDRWRCEQDRGQHRRDRGRAQRPQDGEGPLRGTESEADGQRQGGEADDREEPENRAGHIHLRGIIVTEENARRTPV